MNDLPAQGTLEIEVKNFGPIAKAKVDLRPLTVFVGPGNTGKSYLATLIYALHHYLSGSRWLIYPPSVSALEGTKLRKFCEGIVGVVIKSMEQTLAGKDGSRSSKGVFLPDKVTNVIRDLLEDDNSDIHDEIGRCFGIEASALVRKGSKGGAHVDLRWRNAETLTPIRHQLEIGAQKSKFKTIIPEGARIEVGGKGRDPTFRCLHDIAMGGRERQSDWNAYAYRLSDALLDHVSPQITGLLDCPAYYFPANRATMMRMHKALVRSLVKRGLRSGSETQTALSGVLLDFLDGLIGIEPDRRPMHRHDLVAAEIGKNILGGSIKVDMSEAGYPSFTYSPEGWKKSLPLTSASSTVSELAPVVLYLRHIVRSNGVLIIEEPEAHLHPAMQVEFIRQLAMAVKLGVRVIVTTHSEWIFEELTNIVLRSRLPQTNREKEDVANGQVSLRADQVGVWLFQLKSRPKGAVPKEITPEESGLYPAGFDDVAITLHNEWASISSRIAEGE